MNTFIVSTALLLLLVPSSSSSNASEPTGLRGTIPPSYVVTYDPGPVKICPSQDEMDKPQLPGSYYEEGLQCDFDYVYTGTECTPLKMCRYYGGWDCMVANFVCNPEIEYEDDQVQCGDVCQGDEPTAAPIDMSEEDKNITIYQDTVDMSEEDKTKVFDWIRAEMTMAKNPFCWKDSYGRGGGTVPGRVADCPSSYTNNGVTCGRGSDDILAPSLVADCPAGYTNYGLTCFRGVSDISAPSLVADCPDGWTNMGLTCFTTHDSAFPWNWESKDSGSFTCPSGYFKSDLSQRCHKDCASDFINTGEFCHQDAVSLGFDVMTCPDGYVQSEITARCIKDCPDEYTNMGETCHRFVSTLGTGSMHCKFGESKGGVDGERCYPGIPGDGSMCFNGEDFDAGLCYPQCEDGFSGVGPVCWQSCDDSMVNCGFNCGKDLGSCGGGVLDMAVSTLMLAINIASLGLTIGPSKAADAALDATTTTIKIAGKTVAGTGKVGQAAVKFVKKTSGLKTVTETAAGTKVITNVHYPTGVLKKVGTNHVTSTVKEIMAIDEYTFAYSEDFAAQTSEEIEDELDSHFHNVTAKYLKEQWAVKQLAEIAEVNNWEITSNILIAASIVDPTGLFGVVSAYAKPVCYAVVPFPCTAYDISGNVC